MPVYRAKRTIGQSVQLVIRQTYTDWELIIVLDGDEYAVLYDERIQKVTNEHNMVVAFSHNRSIKLACGAWVAFF